MISYWSKRRKVLVDVEVLEHVYRVHNIQQSSSLDVLTESANSANIVSHDESDHETLDIPSDNDTILTSLTLMIQVHIW